MASVVSENNSNGQTTQCPNLVRCKPSGVHYARARRRGKLIRRPLTTQRISVAKLLLSDFEKSERQRAENRSSGIDDRITFGAAKEVYRQRLNGNPALKPRTKDYHKQQLIALVKSWPRLNRIIKTIRCPFALIECAPMSIDEGDGRDDLLFDQIRRRKFRLSLRKMPDPEMLPQVITL